jgi:nucleolar protein 14
MALKQRQQHVQADRQASKQSNVFLDRRLTAATPQEQVLQRLVKERLQGANSRRRTKFQLHDDDDGGGDDGESWRRRRKNGGGGSNSAGSDLLTHRGKALKDLSASDHVILSDAEEDYGDLEELDTDLHFGGGTGLLNPANPYGPNSGSGAGNNPSLLSAVYSRRKTELDDLILRRKIAKAEKLQSKEEQVDTFEKLDDAYGDLAPLLQFRDKRQMYPTEVDDEMADWDREVNTLMLKRKVAATNRTKTAEEIAKEEADRLHELETKRLARMNGDFEDDDLSDVSVADAAVSRYRGQSSAFPPAPEALDDDIVEKKRASEKQEFTMKFTADGLAKVDSQGDVIVEAAPTAKLSPSVIHAVGTRVSANYHASEQLEGYSAWYDGVIKRVYRDDDGSITYDIDYDDGDFEEGVEPKHVRLQNESKAVAKGTSAAQTQEDDKKVKLKRQKAKDQARYVYRFASQLVAGVVCGVSGNHQLSRLCDNHK